jgi:hypothetical protein
VSSGSEAGFERGVSYERGVRVLQFRDWLAEILTAHGGTTEDLTSYFEDGTAGQLTVRAPDGTLIEVRCRIMEE